MITRTFTHSYIRPLLGILLFVATMIAVLFSGCAKNLSGDLKANTKPSVQFVNIPPDGQQFSRNPVVYWYGTDVDGVISFYRYHVATVSALGAQTPEQYIAAADSSAWVYLEVDPTGVNSQQTQVSISLVADSLDPVLSFVSQYVFIQAYDNEGQSSDVEYRLFSRNDNPPQTLLFNSLTGTKDAPYVNAPTAGGIITGVRFNWQGTDPIDYPSDPPPFEFEWKLFGPYTDAEVTTLRTQFVVKRFVTREGKVFDIGDTLINCNEDSTDCDTVTVTVANTNRIAQIFGADYGVFEETFLANAPAFVSDTAPVTGKYRLAASSFDGDSWVTKTADTIYNVFANSTSSTTTQRQFLFWLRSRDDAKVPDLVPTYRFVHVIDPRYERSAIVVDFTFRGNPLYSPTISQQATKEYFKNAMTSWDPTVVFDTVMDTLTGIGDYVSIQRYGAGRRIPISWLLSHKVVILYNDNTAAANLDFQANYYTPVFTAIDGGVNAWVTARSPLSVGTPTGPNEATELILTPRNPGYTTYFGVVGMAYGGFFCHAFNYAVCPIFRIEDFVGGFSLLAGDPGWPDVSVDSARLGNPAIASWSGNFTNVITDEDGNPIDTIYTSLAWLGDPAHGLRGAPALPEVNWSQRLTPGTEGLYLYRSYYENQHPLGGPYSFQGAPCAHRFNTGLYRTVHFNFTPVVMEQTSMQTVFNSVMDWLSDEGNASPTARLRYDDAPMPMSKDVQRENYKRRLAEEEQKYLSEHPELVDVNFR